MKIFSVFFWWVAKLPEMKRINERTHARTYAHARANRMYGRFLSLLAGNLYPICTLFVLCAANFSEMQKLLPKKLETTP